MLRLLRNALRDGLRRHLHRRRYPQDRAQLEELVLVHLIADHLEGVPLLVPRQALQLPGEGVAQERRMPHGHDRAERAEQRRSLLSGHVARPLRLVHAQELGREGGVEVLVGVVNDGALVELLGKRGPALLVVLLPEVGHEVAHRRGAVRGGLSTTKRSPLGQYPGDL